MERTCPFKWSQCIILNNCFMMANKTMNLWPKRLLNTARSFHFSDFNLKSFVFRSLLNRVHRQHTTLKTLRPTGWAANTESLNINKLFRNREYAVQCVLCPIQFDICTYIYMYVHMDGTTMDFVPKREERAASPVAIQLLLLFFLSNFCINNTQRRDMCGARSAAIKKSSREEKANRLRPSVAAH